MQPATCDHSVLIVNWNTRDLLTRRLESVSGKCFDWQDCGPFLHNGWRFRCAVLYYWYDVAGRQGWRTRYVKEVDSSEQTVRFYQEIYDNTGQLVEMHEKYPSDKGHRKVTE